MSFYRPQHRLRVVTLASRESTGQVLYHPSYFAHLASSPNPGDVTPQPVPAASRETRGISIAETLLITSIGLSMYGFIGGNPWLLGAAAVLLLGGCVVTR